MFDGVIVAAKVGRNGVKVGSGVNVSAGVKVGGTTAGSVSGAVSVRVGSRGWGVLVDTGVFVGGRVGLGVLPWVLQANTARSSSPIKTPNPLMEMPFSLTIQEVQFITLAALVVKDPAGYPGPEFQVLIHLMP